mmetsp:Transcript_4122/g.11359  ORF Transcript_4122/g.11359 Transcript_4122/m.11359 type:complete len:540 (-) Transcript_4122:221-1840(-)
MGDFEYLIVTDLDGVCGGDDPDVTYSPSVFREAFQRTDEWDQLTFRFDPYWDLWAFRHPEVMPHNKFGIQAHKNKFNEQDEIDHWIKEKDESNLLLVDSAFMMLAIYRLSKTVGCQYNGFDEDEMVDCEHVRFHFDMKKLHNAKIRLWPVVYCQGDPGFRDAFQEKDKQVYHIPDRLTFPGGFTMNRLQHGTASASRDVLLVTRDSWRLILSDQNPYSKFAPNIDVVWSRGWYNVHLPPKTVPISYYNKKGRSTEPAEPDELRQWFGGKDSAACGYVWLRTGDIEWWATNILPTLNCDVILITGDGDTDIPLGLSVSKAIVNSKWVQGWYAQNVVRKHKKLHPIPIGLNIHSGYPGSPDSVDTLGRMSMIREKAKAFNERSRAVLFDIGTLGEKDSRRYTARKEIADALSACIEGGVIERMPAVGQVEAWERYASHQFAIAPAGMGWDTHRLWEYLFFGTVPIVKTSPLDLLLLPSHVPVVIVENWEEVCSWSGAKYAALAEKYSDWIANSHHWLRPTLWIPWDHAEMERLCDTSRGCR